MDGDTTEILSAPSAQAGPAGLPSHEDLTPKEQAVLEEYERLAENMKKVGCPQSPFLCFPSNLVARHPSQRLGRPAGDGDARRAAGAGAQDESGVYAAQGECVQHCAAAPDRRR